MKGRFYAFRGQKDFVHYKAKLKTQIKICTFNFGRRIMYITWVDQKKGARTCLACAKKEPLTKVRGTMNISNPVSRQITTRG